MNKKDRVAEIRIVGAKLPIVNMKNKKIPIYLYGDADIKEGKDGTKYARIDNIIYNNKYLNRHFTVIVNGIKNDSLGDFINAFWDKFAYKTWGKQDNILTHHVGLMTEERDFNNIVYCTFYCENMDDFYSCKIYDMAKDMVTEFAY